MWAWVYGNLLGASWDPSGKNIQIVLHIQNAICECVHGHSKKMDQCTKIHSETQTHVWGEGNLKIIVARVQDTYQHLQNSVFKNLCSIFPRAETGKSGSHLDAFLGECRLRKTSFGSARLTESSEKIQKASFAAFSRTFLASGMSTTGCAHGPERPKGHVLHPPRIR